MNEKTIFETHPHLPSGKWEGFYTQFGVNSKMECVLEFRKQQIRGYGSDSLGSFVWEGQYDLEVGRCQMVKTYVGAYSVFYKGTLDENGIWGTWQLISLSGGFHLWPKSNKSSNRPTAKEVLPINKPQPIML